MILRLAIVFAVLFAVARADESESKRHYEDGKKAFFLQDFKGALREFQAAYVEKPDPVLLYNIGQCQHQLAQYEAAGRSYRAFLNTSSSLSEGQRQEVQMLVRQMDDAARVEHTSHQTATKVPASAVPSAPVAVAAAPPRPWYRNAAGMSVAGAGLAAAVAGAVLVGIGARELDDARGATTLPRQRALQNESDTLTTAGWVVLGIGGAALVTGAIVLAVRR
jgi:tetratricopeptide (TPR) repeat protein